MVYGTVHVVRDVGQCILVRREIAGLLVLQGMEDVTVVLTVDENQWEEVDVDMVSLNTITPFADVISTMT